MADPISFANFKAGFKAIAANVNTQFNQIATVINNEAIGQGVNANPTIRRDSNNKLNAIGVLNSNGNGAIKTWVGLKADFDDISTKDSSTLYYITDEGKIYFGDTPISNTNSGRYMGELVVSTVPLADATLHPLDGSELSENGMYQDFVEYIKNLYETTESATTKFFTTETDWQTTQSTYGVCGKFVYTEGNGSGTDYYKWTFVGQQDVYTRGGAPHVGDSVYSKSGSTFTEIGTVSEGNGSEGAGWYYSANRLLHVVSHSSIYYYSRDSISYGYSKVRLPKITGIIEGTDSETSLGNVVEAGLPNITGECGSESLTDNEPFTDCDGAYSNGALSLTNESSYGGAGTSSGVGYCRIKFNAHNSNTIYGNSSTVQPQTVKVFYYIVVGTSVTSTGQVNLDEIATDLSNKLDKDMSNLVSTSSATNTVVGWGMPDYDNVIKIVEGTPSYTAPCHGLFIFNLDQHSTDPTVNGKTVWVIGNDEYNEGSVTLLLSKDDVVTIPVSSGNIPASFIPLKGAVQ